MKRSIINITIDSNYAEVLFENGKKEIVGLTQPKLELYKSAKIQLDELSKGVKKNMSIGWTFTGLAWITLPLIMFNSVTSYALLPIMAHENVSSLIAIAVLVSIPYHLKSLYYIHKRDNLSKNIDAINKKLDKSKEYEVSEDYFMGKDLSVKNYSPLYSKLMFDLHKELMNNPIKYEKSWEYKYEEEVQKDFVNSKHMNEKLCAEEVNFEMVNEVPKENAMVKALRR